MILTVDIGNTTVCVCGVERRESAELAARFCTRLSTVHGKSGTEYAAELRQALEDAQVAPEEIAGAVVSSVVPCLNEPIHACICEVLGQEPVWITCRSRTGLTLDVEHPEKLGIDRIVDAAWVAANCPLPAITVDLGTCTTFNVIDEGGVFRGGAICVGMATGLKVLAAKAAQLPELRLDRVESVIGRNTEACMASGAAIGAAAMIWAHRRPWCLPAAWPALRSLSAPIRISMNPICWPRVCCCCTSGTPPSRSVRRSRPAGKTDEKQKSMRPIPEGSDACFSADRFFCRAVRRRGSPRCPRRPRRCCTPGTPAPGSRPC